MGFSPSLVEKVIQEKGEDNADLLLETLIEYSDVQKAKSQSSDYLNSLFVGKDIGGCPEISTCIQPKEEPDVFDEDLVDKRASLLMMHFSVDEVEFALEKLGEDAPVNELVDFIAAAQIAEKLEKESEDSLSSEEETDQVPKFQLQSLQMQCSLVIFLVTVLKVKSSYQQLQAEG